LYGGEKSKSNITLPSLATHESQNSNQKSKNRRTKSHIYA